MLSGCHTPAGLQKRFKSASEVPHKKAAAATKAAPIEILLIALSMVRPSVIRRHPRSLDVSQRPKVGLARHVHRRPIDGPAVYGVPFPLLDAGAKPGGGFVLGEGVFL